MDRLKRAIVEAKEIKEAGQPWTVEALTTELQKYPKETVVALMVKEKTHGIDRVDTPAQSTLGAVTIVGD